MVSISQIRDLVHVYLGGEPIKLQDFADQFESLYGQANVEDVDPDVLAYADCISSFIARVRAGYSSEADLKVWLEPLSNDPPLAINDGYRDVSSSLPYELASAR